MAATAKAEKTATRSGTKHLVSRPGEPKVYILEPDDSNRIRIFIPLLEAGDGEKVDQDVPVTVNGYTTIIRRGEYVDVTYSVYEALKHTGRFPRMT